jgi:putative SOS response-associated peptidase YedK
MCYHSSDPTKEALKRAYAKNMASKQKEAIDENYKQRKHINGFSFPKLMVVTQAEPEKINFLNWGLVPNWFSKKGATEAEQNKSLVQIKTATLNAKSETIFELPSFKTVIENQRCLIISGGFFEWQHIGNQKIPYFISLKNEEAFSFGGIYSNWVDQQTGEIINSCSIITCEANPLMAQIHNTKKRMPFILPKNKEDDWLKPNFKKDEIVNLMSPLNENLMATSQKQLP